jgi:pimeloyl-ACP methyl ester carboxylesterase
MDMPRFPLDDAAKIGAGALAVAVVFGLVAETIESTHDFSQLASDPIFFGIGVPRRDGHSVMVVPGWLADDRYLQPMLGWLGRIGYRPIASGIKRNTGQLDRLAREVAERLQQRVDENGRPASIIGHGLGGVIAHRIARRRPDVVCHAITMGSPLNIDAAPIDAGTPLTAIYSREDRLVRYPRALAPGGLRVGGRGIEVTGCHCGMVFNSQVYRAVGRLFAERRPL